MEILPSLGILTLITLAVIVGNSSVDYMVGLVGMWIVTLAVSLWVRRFNKHTRAYVAASWTARVLVVMVFGVWIEGYYRAKTGLDADTYHALGQYVAHLFAQGVFPNIGPGEIWNGTAHYIVQTGVIYWTLFPSAQLMKVLNTVVSFFGTIGFYSVYKKAKRKGGSSKDLPLLFLFLMPSTLYWTTIHGKDPWMYAYLGMGVFFAGRFLEAFRPWDFFGMALGILGMAWIRPHVAAIFALSLVVFALVRRYRYGALTPMVRVGALVVAVALAFLAVRAVMEAFQVRTPEEALQFATRQGEASAYGRTAIRLPEIHGFRSLLLFYPIGFLTILFRPFPWEAHSPFALISALENLILLIFSVQHLRRHRWKPSNEIGLFAGVYVLLFVLAFYPATGNLGTLVRQKVQLLPFWFLYLGSLPSRRKDYDVRD